MKLRESGRKGKGKGKGKGKDKGDRKVNKLDADFVGAAEGEEEGPMDRADYFLLQDKRNQVANGMEEENLSEMICGLCEDDGSRKPALVNPFEFFAEDPVAVQAPKGDSRRSTRLGGCFMAVLCLLLGTLWLSDFPLKLTALGALVQDCFLRYGSLQPVPAQT